MASRLALIDAELLLKLLEKKQPQIPPANPTLSEINHIDDQLEYTLKQKVTPNQPKQISDLLYKHNHHQDNYETPPSIAPTSTSPQQEHIPETDINIDIWFKKTIDHTPKSYQKTAKDLLTHIKNSGVLDWSPNGELIKNGIAIKNSNILDLVHSVVRPRKTAKAPYAAEQFLQGLSAINTPLEFLKNSDVLLESLTRGFSFDKQRIGGHKRTKAVPKRLQRPSAMNPPSLRSNKSRPGRPIETPPSSHSKTSRASGTPSKPRTPAGAEYYATPLRTPKGWKHM